MASLRQIRANRENCKSSLGPSEEGKLKSRLNALRHGMAALDVVFEDDSEKIALAASEWLPELKAVGPFQLYQLERMAAASVLIRRCEDHEADLRYRQASRTEAGVQLDRKAEVEDLALRLPGSPARIALRLQQSVPGIEWILSRLRALKDRLCGPAGSAPVRPLDEAERRRAFDLLGVAAELRVGQTVLDPPAGGGTPSDADVAAYQVGAIGDRIIDLERFKTEDLPGVEAIDHDAGAIARDTKVNPEIHKIRRYLKDAQRRYDVAKAELLRLQAVAAEAARIAASAPPRAREIEPSYVTPLSTTPAGAAGTGSDTTARPMTEEQRAAILGAMYRPRPPVAESAPVDAAEKDEAVGQPASTVAENDEPVGPLASTAAESAPADDGHLNFQAALDEPVLGTRSGRRREKRNGGRAARAAHRGFAG